MIELSKVMRLAADYLGILVNDDRVTVPPDILDTFLNIVSMISGLGDDKLIYDIGKYAGKEKNENKDKEIHQEA